MYLLGLSNLRSLHQLLNSFESRYLRCLISWYLIGKHDFDIVYSVVINMTNITEILNFS